MGKLNKRRALKKKANRENYEKRRNVNRNLKPNKKKLINPPSKKNRYKNIEDMNYEEEAKLRMAWGFKLNK